MAMPNPIRVVYIAGPMRGIPQFNFPEFAKAQTILRTLGYIVLSPHEHDLQEGFDPAGMDGHEDLSAVGFDLRAALKWDTEAVLRSDAICKLPNSLSSRGATAEMALARAIDIPVMFLNEFYPKELKGYAGEGYVEVNGKVKKLPIGDDGGVAWDNYGPLTDSSIVDREQLAKNVKLFTEASVNPNKRVADAPLSNQYFDGTAQGQVWFSKDTVAKLGTAGLKKMNEALNPNKRPNEVLKGQYVDSMDVRDFVPPKSDKFVKGSEIRSVSSTGGEKGVKSARFDLIPTSALQQLAEHYGVGALKYDDNQWRKGYEYSKSYAAMQRHLTAWWGGEDTDEETGSSHLAAAAWHCFTLMTFLEDHPDFDDRYKS